MRILNICLTGPFTEGFAYQDNLLAKYYTKLGHECFIVAPVEKYNKGKIEKIKSGTKVIENGITLIRLELEKKLPEKVSKKLRVYKGLYERIEQINPDIIFVHGGQFLDIRHVVKYAKKNPKTKIFVDNHADYNNSAKNILSKIILHKMIWKKCIKMIEPYTTKFYGVVPARCDFLNQVYEVKQEKIELLVLGADTDRIDFKNKIQITKKIRKKYNIKESDFLLVTGGKIDTNKKEILTLMETIEKNKNPEIKLMIFGSVSEEIESEFKSLVDNVKIIFIGWIDSREVYNYFLASDLGVFLSGHSVLWEQAVGTGLPCLFREQKGFYHVDLGGNCQFLNTITQPEIEKYISNIYKNKILYTKMRKSANEKGIKYFSYEKIAERSIIS